MTGKNVMTPEDYADGLMFTDAWDVDPEEQPWIFNAVAEEFRKAMAQAREEVIKNYPPMPGSQIRWVKATTLTEVGDISTVTGVSVGSGGWSCAIRENPLRLSENEEGVMWERVSPDEGGDVD